MNDFKQICRICLLPPKNGPLVATGADFIKQMQSQAGIVLSHPNNCKWPENICSECIALMKAASKLRALCEKAEDLLQILKKEIIVKATTDENTELDEVEKGVITPQIPSITVLNGKLKIASNEIKTRFYKIDLKMPTTISEECIGSISHPSTPTRTPKSSACFKCHICHNVYTNKVKFTAHLKIHSQKKPHECEICHKRFRQTPQLTRHMNSHTGLRPYKCNYCESSFGDPSTRYKHQRIHTNERPYKCTYCEKSFNYSNVLDVHLKTHTGERPHSCTYCGQRFSQLHHKNSHEKGHMDSKLSCSED